MRKRKQERTIVQLDKVKNNVKGIQYKSKKGEGKRSTRQSGRQPSSSNRIHTERDTNEEEKMRK